MILSLKGERVNIKRELLRLKEYALDMSFFLDFVIETPFFHNNKDYVEDLKALKEVKIVEKLKEYRFYFTQEVGSNSSLKLVDHDNDTSDEKCRVETLEEVLVDIQKL